MNIDLECFLDRIFYLTLTLKKLVNTDVTHNQLFMKKIRLVNMGDARVNSGKFSQQSAVLILVPVENALRWGYTYSVLVVC